VEITEIRIKLMEGSEDRLRGFCSITIDGSFVVRDLKIIDGTSGPFVAMPSRKLAGHCQRCRHKNHLRAGYCNHCGIKLQMDNGGYDSPQKLYADVAHPINSECRELIQNAVIEEFDAELNRSRQPGYRSRYDDDFDYEIAPIKSVAAGPSTPVLRTDQAAPAPTGPMSPTTSGDRQPAPARPMADPTSDPTIQQVTEQVAARPEQLRVAPQKARSETTPPRPHFADRGSSGPSRRERVSPDGDHEHEDAKPPNLPGSGFGEGIFD